MRILGIDPGVATVGFGVIEAQAGRQQMIQYGAITTPAGQPLAARLVQIAQDMETLITQFQPDEMSIEELYFSKNITTGIAVRKVMAISRKVQTILGHTTDSYLLRAGCSSDLLQTVK